MLRKYAPGLWEKRTEVGIDLYRRASPAIITAHKCPRRKWVAACFNDSSSTVMNKTEKWQRLDASRECGDYNRWAVHSVLWALLSTLSIRLQKKKKSLICVTPALYTRDFFFCLKDFFFLFFFNLNAPKCHRVCKSGLDPGQTDRRKLKKEDWKRWNKWINNPLRCFIKKQKQQQQQNKYWCLDEATTLYVIFTLVQFVD